MTQDFIQDLIKSCNREGKVFVLAVGDFDSGSVEVFENASAEGRFHTYCGKSVPEILSSSIGEALGLDDDSGESWKRQ